MNKSGTELSAAKQEVGSRYSTEHYNIGWTKDRVALYGDASLGMKVVNSCYTSSGVLVAVTFRDSHTPDVCLKGVWEPDEKTTIVNYETLVKMGGIEIRGFDSKQLKGFIEGY